jgi:hypothetical protein
MGIGSGMAVVNLSCGKEMGKIQVEPNRSDFFHLLQPAPRTKGRLLVRAYASVDEFRRVAAFDLPRLPQRRAETSAPPKSAKIPRCSLASSKLLMLCPMGGMWVSL